MRYRYDRNENNDPDQPETPVGREPIAYPARGHYLGLCIGCPPMSIPQLTPISTGSRSAVIGLEVVVFIVIAEPTTFVTQSMGASFWPGIIKNAGLSAANWLPVPVDSIVGTPFISAIGSLGAYPGK